jgi:hypothetical protein
MFGHCIDLVQELWRREVGFTFDFFAEVSVHESSSQELQDNQPDHALASWKINL